jgi:hypothetical protein
MMSSIFWNIFDNSASMIPDHAIAFVRIPAPMSPQMLWPLKFDNVRLSNRAHFALTFIAPLVTVAPAVPKTRQSGSGRLAAFHGD